jgi:anti-sigma factor RsiW
MNLSVQHLSDEALAAFADGVLSPGARGRAERHIAECPECAHSVAEQRAAVWALRAAPAPSLPGGLLDRLRQLPSTTDLPSSPLALAPDGSAVFPSFGMPAGRHTTVFSRLMPMSQPARRRSQHVALVTAAVALVTLGAVGSTAGNAITRPSTAQPGSRVAPSGSVLVNFVPSQHR